MKFIIHALSDDADVIAAARVARDFEKENNRKGEFRLFMDDRGHYYEVIQRKYCVTVYC